jgi:hypothetical protein
MTDSDSPKPEPGTRERIVEIAHKIADKLAEHGFVAPALLIADIIQPIMFPPHCSGCGLRMCPQCDGHCMPGILDSVNEYEKHDLCFDCKICIKPDDTVFPVEENDVRWKEMAHFQESMIDQIMDAHMPDSTLPQPEAGKKKTDKKYIN